MLVMATVGFSGAVSMSEGSTAEITDGVILQDLLRAGYVVEVKAVEEVKPRESKRNKSKRNL